MTNLDSVRASLMSTKLSKSRIKNQDHFQHVAMAMSHLWKVCLIDLQMPPVNNKHHVTFKNIG